MRFLANENFPGDTVEALRIRGHDVVWIRTDAPGSSDIEVLRRAQAEGRTLLTFDKDFGELAFRLRMALPHGIVLFRMRASSPQFVVHIAVAALESRTDWVGHFSVIEADRIRMTPMP